VRVTLPVAEGEGVNDVPFRGSEGQERGGVEATTEKEDSWTFRHEQARDGGEVTGKLAAASRERNAERP